MKASSLILTSCIGSLSAANLMLDFGPTTVASPYETLSPAHHAGTVISTETSWNTLSSSADRSDLVFSDGSSAVGITLNLGQESTSGNGIISFSTELTKLTLAGTGGGAAGQQSLLGTGSIYGSDSSSTAAGRDGVFGDGSGGAGSAIGMRVDGLAAGSYTIYLMGRNTNSNVGSLPMNLFAAVGADSSTFDFSSLSPTVQSNPGYATASYAGEFTSFTSGDNFVSIDVTVTEGQSLFLVSDGADAAETRGFLNMVQIVEVPEPSTASLALVAGALLLRRRRL
ncbi:hypothetical protein HNR46_003129 [Haloferula luteola]|uniref:PEP-CTERM protein-sorting domain-containing protein n=1 Tax=Haloferula luteola TaxID=595692 RepID=A0A840VGC4_9BACT|nr:hypothetical protein [Haloferula luteola]MBB5352880.1 hypothetical protein [Haloferula luteola]